MMSSCVFIHEHRDHIAISQSPKLKIERELTFGEVLMGILTYIIDVSIALVSETSKLSIDDGFED